MVLPHDRPFNDLGNYICTGCFIRDLFYRPADGTKLRVFEIRCLDPNKPLPAEDVQDREDVDQIIPEPNKHSACPGSGETDVSISEPLIVSDRTNMEAQPNPSHRVPIKTPCHQWHSEPSGMPDKLFVRSSSHFPTCEGTSGFRKKALPQEVGIRTVLVSHQVFWKAGRNSIHPHPRVLKYLPARTGGDTSSYPEPRAEYGIEIP